MADARRLDDVIAISELFYTATTGGSTASGSWQDLEQFVGDVLVVVDVHSITGSGTVTVTVQGSAANTGSSPATAVGTAAIAIATASVTPPAVFVGAYDPGENLQFLGVNVSYTGVTGSILTVALIGRHRTGP